MGEDDWRLRGQERYLQGAILQRQRYKAWSQDWEHDHCEFCWAKFMDPELSPERARFVADHPELLIEGYTVKGRQPGPSSSGVLARAHSRVGPIESEGVSAERDDYWWVCPTCVKDFAARFEWIVIEEVSPGG